MMPKNSSYWTPSDRFAKVQGTTNTSKLTRDQNYF
jgi:hypothetical protein